MCGIWGLMSASDRMPLAEEESRECVRGLRHRGPDGEGFIWAPPYTLGHTRLAVLDRTAAASQPMSSGDGKVHLVCNGEIFNYEELRTELRAAGYQFRGTGDSEVLLAAYQHWGTGCLHRLNGMFAFAIADEARGSLLLARDRFGMKPLYYLAGDGFLGFCSEPKGLLPMLAEPPTLDLAALSAFLCLRHVPAPRTLFAELRQVPAGAFLLWQRDAGSRTATWWDLPRRRPPMLPIGRARQLRALISDAVRLWSRSDVPVAAYLSGGLDSSVLLAELARHRPGLIAMTADLADPGYSEVAAARAMASHVNVRLEVIPADVRVAVAELARLCRYRDHPLALHNEVAIFRLARAIREHAPVVVSGEGADELFGGYGRLFRFPFEQRKQRAAGMLRIKRLGSYHRDRSREPLTSLLATYAYLPSDVQLRLFKAAIRDALTGDSWLNDYLWSVWTQPKGGQHRRLSYFLIKVHLPGLLQVMDAANMAFGVEARLPFLDHRVAEWAYALPERGKLRWKGPWSWLRALTETPARYSENRDVTKWILRRAYQPVLPRLIIERAKMPFPTPLNEWLSSTAGESMRAFILEVGARLTQLFDPQELAAWWDSAGYADANFGKQAWLLVNLEVWLREYFPHGEIKVKTASQEAWHDSAAFQSRSY
jgi:asparagine synthase (glutamine-hydrolysing)